MKKWIILMLACSSLALSACGGKDNKEATVDNQQEKVFVVGTNAEFAPFESLNSTDEIAGFDIDLLNAMAKAGNFKVKFEHKPWESIFPALTNKDVDLLISAVTITDERKQSYDFTDPYFQITQVVLLPDDETITSINDLKDFDKIGVVNGQTGDYAVSQLLGNDNSKISRLESLPLLIKSLETGALNAVVSDSAVVGNYLKNNPDSKFKMIKLPDFETENYGIVVRKGDVETLKLLNDSLKTIRENGDYQTINDKYFSDN